MERNRERDNRVARQLLGYVVSDLQREIVQIEHRYSQLSDRSQWDAMVCIGNREFRWNEVKFFHILSDVLNELPDGSYLVIPHNVLVSHDGILQIAMLEERLYPYYEDRTPGGESGEPSSINSNSHWTMHTSKLQHRLNLDTQSRIWAVRWSS